MAENCGSDDVTLKEATNMAWVLKNESDELRTKIGELETNTDIANARNEELMKALGMKHGESLHWYNAYHTGEAIANDKFAVLGAHVKYLEAQLRMKDGVILRQDSNFSGLQEQQQMRRGQMPGQGMACCSLTKARKLRPRSA